MKDSVTKRILFALVIPFLVIIAWYLATSRGSIPVGILPTIPMVGEGFKEMVKSGQLQTDLTVSLARVLKGYVLSAVFGILLGSLVGMFQIARQMLIPMITVIRQIPIIAWIPLIIMWAGIGEMSKVIIIVLAAFFPILVNTENGIESTPKGYVEVARLYKLGPWKTFTKVYLPHALPGILVGLKLGLGVSWMAVVAAELIASTTGIGYRMSYARGMMQANIVIVCMIVIGLVGVIMDKLIGCVFKKLLIWERVENNHDK